MQLGHGICIDMQYYVVMISTMETIVQEQNQM